MPEPRKVGRPRPLRADLPGNRVDFDQLKARIDELTTAVERLQRDYAIQVQRTADLQGALTRLTQHVQVLTATLPKPPHHQTD
jgi:hypothetical protein